jgi:guanylate kinase
VTPTGTSGPDRAASTRWLWRPPADYADGDHGSDGDCGLDGHYGEPMRLTVLSGPSGVGKGTVVAAVRRRYPDVWVSVSCTTRSPRPGETHGVEYHFVDAEEFARMVSAGEFVEHAMFAGHAYGTPRAPLAERLARGERCLLEVELQGARQVRASMPDARFVFLTPPSWDELVRRLTGRGTEPPEVVRRRLDRARIELTAESEFDEVVVNDDVEAAAGRLVALMTSC